MNVDDILKEQKMVGVAYRAGQEDVAKVYWKAVCENLANLAESNALNVESALKDGFGDDVATVARALSTVLRVQAQQFRTWAADKSL